VGKQWDYQIRINLGDEFADAARRAADDPVLTPLTDILARHRATMKCQFDAFADYVAEAERQGAAGYPLYAWTKATIEDPAKQAKYRKSFTIYVDGNEVYAKETADALESELRPLVGGALITRLSKHDTNRRTTRRCRSAFAISDHHCSLSPRRGGSETCPSKADRPALRSRASSARFRWKPQRYPEIEPSFFTTR
jgi:hypothetical protein